MSKRAIVLSAGRTGTQWLASVLNLHPDVVFAHGLDQKPRRKISSAEYQEDAERIHSEIDNLDWTDIDGYFERIEATSPGLKAYGNIHGIRLEWLEPKLAEYRTRITLCAMLRDPVLRTQSFANRWLNKKAWGGQTPKYDLQGYLHDFVLEACDKYERSYDDADAIFFINALAIIVNSDSAHARVGIPLFPMERVTGDLSYFVSVFRFLTGIEADADYVRSVQSIKPIDKLTDQAEESAAPLLFRQWPDWKRAHFIDVISTSGIEPLYRGNGYWLPRFGKDLWGEPFNGERTDIEFCLRNNQGHPAARPAVQEQANEIAPRCFRCESQMTFHGSINAPPETVYRCVPCGIEVWQQRGQAPYVPPLYRRQAQRETAPQRIGLASRVSRYFRKDQTGTYTQPG